MEENYVRHVRACQDATWHSWGSWLIIYSWRFRSAFIQLAEFLSKPKVGFCSQLVATQLCVYVNRPQVHSVIWDSYNLGVKCFGTLFPSSQLRIWSYSLFSRFVVFTWRSSIQADGNSPCRSISAGHIYLSLEAYEAFSAAVLGELALKLHAEGETEAEFWGGRPVPPALTSGVTCNPIRASVSILGK